jgi:predicted transcriptional regulator
VYQNLNGVPMSAAQLAQLTRKNKSTVGRALKELKASGLAVATSTTPRGDPTGWVRGPADPARPDTIRRAQFEREREQLREHYRRKGGNSK